MRILFLGKFGAEPDDCRTQANGFEAIGCEVLRYNYRIRLSLLGQEGRDREIALLAARWKPDLVFISKGDGLSSAVIEMCNAHSLTCLWYMDPMGNYDQEFIEKIPIVTFSCFGLRAPLEASRKFSDDVYWVPEAYDPLFHYPLPAQKIYDATFIGSLKVLRGGTHGERALYHEKVRFKVIQNVFDEKHSLAVSQSRINLNFTEPGSGGTSVRLYRIMASGGFALTTPWQDMEEQFIVEKHLDIFSSPEELQDKIEYYLKHENKREMIAQNGLKIISAYDNRSFARKIHSIACHYGSV